MDLAETQAVCLQTRFLPEGVAQGIDEPRGNGQVAVLPQWTEVPSPRMNASHQVDETCDYASTRYAKCSARYESDSYDREIPPIA